MRRRPKTARVAEALEKLRGEEVTLRMEDPRRPGMAIGYRGKVGLVLKVKGKYVVRLGYPPVSHMIGKIEKIEITGPLTKAGK